MNTNHNTNPKRAESGAWQNVRNCSFYYALKHSGKCKYECELKESELPGAAISEIGLYDADGDIVTIKRFTAKGKDADISMTFYINDTF